MAEGVPNDFQIPLAYSFGVIAGDSVDVQEERLLVEGDACCPVVENDQLLLFLKKVSEGAHGIGIRCNLVNDFVLPFVVGSDAHFSLHD